jgi:hypothetical protein
MCGGARWSTSVNVVDNLALYDELGLAVTNTDGELVAERIQKTDLNTNASLAADLGSPSKISVERTTPVDGFDEEGVVAEALVKSYNKLRRTNYRVVPKTEEDSDYADRVFTSESDEPPQLNVQISHFESDIVANVGRSGTFDGERSNEDILQSIAAAIQAKANVDPKVKELTILQLIVPAPIGEGLKQSIQSHSFNTQGFLGVWVSPFHEESFPLTSV